MWLLWPEGCLMFEASEFRGQLDLSPLPKISQKNFPSNQVAGKASHFGKHWVDLKGWLPGKGCRGCDTPFSLVGLLVCCSISTATGMVPGKEWRITWSNNSVFFPKHSPNPLNFPSGLPPLCGRRKLKPSSWLSLWSSLQECATTSSKQLFWNCPFFSNPFVRVIC